MEKEGKRIPIELTEESIEKYCYFITEEKNEKNIVLDFIQSIYMKKVNIFMEYLLILKVKAKVTI